MKTVEGASSSWPRLAGEPPSAPVQARGHQSNADSAEMADGTPGAASLRNAHLGFCRGSGPAPVSVARSEASRSATAGVGELSVAPRCDRRSQSDTGPGPFDLTACASESPPRVLWTRDRVTAWLRSRRGPRGRRARGPIDRLVLVQYGCTILGGRHARASHL